MRVLIVSAFPPDPAPEANHALHITEHLARSGLEVHVVSRRGSIAAPEPNVLVHPVIEDWTWSDLPRLVSVLRRLQPDVVLLLYIGWVYGHEPMITFLPTICRSVLPGVPCVTQFEAFEGSVPPRPLRARALHKAAALWAGRKDVHRRFGTLLRDSTSTIVLSSPHRDRLAKHDPEVREKTFVVPPPPLLRVCAEEPAIARRRTRDTLGLADTDFVLVFWGYIYPGKGLETLFEAFRVASRRHPDMRLLVAGGNLEIPKAGVSCRDYFQMVHQLPDTLGIAERVIWTGPFRWDSDAGSRYLHAADVCVLPMDYGATLNNSSLAAAGVHGVPVISTELPVGRDEALEHGRNVYLCRPCDPEVLADAIQVLHEADDLRQRLQSGIRDLARQWYDPERMTERLIAVLRAAVSGALVPGRLPSPSPRGGGSGGIRELAGKRPDERAEPTAEPDASDGPVPTSMTPPDGDREPPSGPLVSVIVAVYNVGKYLSQCLDSLVNQTLRDVEIIAVDDASTDDGGAILEDYRSRYPNLRVIQCDHNRGLGSARNIGMGAARGQYVAFTDGDDWADVTMCEALYRRATADDADVLIADARVFYEDSKSFGPFFDQAVRWTLDPRLRAAPFRLSSEPRVLLLEPVAWTKLYRRSFLQKEGIRFEDGMSSYEDVCFHFWVLVKASRISLTDDAYSFYRQNRPGQISGMTHRKIFEVFEVFHRIRRNLAAWGAPTEIWTMLTKVQLRQFEWMLKDRVLPAHRREFFAGAARQFKEIPRAAFRHFARAYPDETAKLNAIRKGWLFAYEALARHRWPASAVVRVLLHARRHRVIEQGLRRGLRNLRLRLGSGLRSLAGRSPEVKELQLQLQALEERLSRPTSPCELASSVVSPSVAVCRIDGQVLLLASCASDCGLSEAVARTEDDYYLSRMAVLREGDTVVDVGAHVGVFSIYLAKRHPFIRVYAVEPDPISFSYLIRNIELNRVSNVTAVNKGLSGDGRRRVLYIDPKSRTCATLHPWMPLQHGVVEAVEADTVTLEQLFRQFGIRHCRLLRIAAPGPVGESLGGFRGMRRVDLLCGEADLDDCPLPHLEVASWRIARQFFWRTKRSARQLGGTVHSWTHQPATRLELPPEVNSPAGA